MPTRSIAIASLVYEEGYIAIFISVVLGIAIWREKKDYLKKRVGMLPDWKCSRIGVGRHYRDFGFRSFLWKRNAICRTIIIDQDTEVPSDYDHVNKLFGMSFGWHRQNSVMFGWIPLENNRISIWSHSHVNGKMIETPISIIKRVSLLVNSV